jgi:hypothetical protein
MDERNAAAFEFDVFALSRDFMEAFPAKRAAEVPQENKNNG